MKKDWNLELKTYKIGFEAIKQVGRIK